MKRLILTAAALLFAGHASATTVNFTGTVTAGFGGVSAGAALTGTYDFDPTTTARVGSTSDFAVFDAITSLSFTIAGYGTGTFSAPGGGPEIQVDDAPSAPNDRYGVTSRASDGLVAPDLGSETVNSFSFRLDDTTNSVFSDALVLPTAPNLSDFTSGSFFLFVNAPSPVFLETRITGTIDSLAVIPLPAALPLALSGLASLGLIGWRRRASAA